MHPHLLRQVRDIQFQADKLLKSKPGIIEVNHNAKYASIKFILKNFLD